MGSRDYHILLRDDGMSLVTHLAMTGGKFEVFASEKITRVMIRFFYNIDWYVLTFGGRGRSFI